MSVEYLKELDATLSTATTNSSCAKNYNKEWKLEALTMSLL